MSKLLRRFFVVLLGCAWMQSPALAEQQRTVAPEATEVTITVAAPDDPVMVEAVSRLSRALRQSVANVRLVRRSDRNRQTTAAGTTIVLLHHSASDAPSWSQRLGVQKWPRGDGYRIKSARDEEYGRCLLVASAEARGILYGCYALAEEIERRSAIPTSLDVESEPRFALRGWESQLDNFWCKWMGGSKDWYRNERYMAYLRDVISRAPAYRINTLALMGRGNDGELHPMVNYDGWERLASTRTAQARRDAKEQAAAIESVSRDARRFGMRLFLWDHELQLPSDFAAAYPEVRGQGAAICPSAPLVWKLLEDKYEEAFSKTPSLSGIILVLSETQINILLGSPCHCEKCRATTGPQIARRIIETALAACRKHHKELIVRNFGHRWDQIDAIFEAVRGVEPKDAFTVMSKMVPWDFFGLDLPPDPLLEVLPDRPCVLEDAIAEFRGITHVIVAPAEYYARHLRRAAAVPAGQGAFFRVDQMHFPRSIFSMPNEFNAWLTGQLLWSPGQSLEKLWHEWAARRYGQAAADGVVAALRRSADIWEHSTNTFGFYCTSAHGELAPFFHDGYNAYGNIIDTAPLRTRSQPELQKTLDRLLYPDLATLGEVVAERQQAVEWAAQSLKDLETARPHLSAPDYDELSHYLRVMHEGAQLWREMGDLFFTGLAILRADGIPDNLVERLRLATERALRQGRRIEQQFGTGAWPVAPDSLARPRLEKILAGLWAEVLDKRLGLDPLPLAKSASVWDHRSPRTDAEELYLALLQTTFDSKPRELLLKGSPELGRLAIEGSSLVVASARGPRLALPLAAPAEGNAWDGAAANRVWISLRAGTLHVRATAEQPWRAWLDRRLLPAGEAKTTMGSFVERQLAPLPLPQSEPAWTERRRQLREEVLQVLGIADLVPPTWDVAIERRGALQRTGYRIEKLTFESYPGMKVPALLYVPDKISGRVPGIVSITGHTPQGKAADYIQQRNVNLALRGCVVLSYEYCNMGERSTAPDPLRGKVYGGGNDHGIRSFSYSRRTPTGLEVLDGIRALDILAARPEVDPERLGFTGESGGSNSTYWIAALDPRVTLAVPVCSVTSFDYWIRTNRNWDWHQRPYGIRRLADIGTLLAMRAPQPLVVINSTGRYDWPECPPEEAQRSVASAREVYRLYGADEAISYHELSSEHGYQEDKRRLLYLAVEKWLRPPFPKGDAELPATVESFEVLRCGLPSANKTYRDVYGEWLAPLPRTPEQPAEASKAELRRFLCERLGLPRPLPAVQANRVGREERGPWFAEFWILQPETGLRLPGVRIGKKGKDATEIVLVPGRDEAAVAQALAAGQEVFAFDPRGTGETLAAPHDAGRARNCAWLVGRPEPGLWALDLLQAARFCQGQFGARTVSVQAKNHFGWSALLAGAAMPDIVPSGAVRLSFASLRDQLRAHGDNALADVPGLFERLDVNQLRALWSRGVVEVPRRP